MPGTNYFSYFPQIENTFTETGTKIATNLFKRVKIRNFSTVVKSGIYYKYTIKDGERPEDIADRYYGDTQYYWIILYANDIINIYAQWPRSQRDFEEYLIDRYGSIEDIANENDTVALHHYEDGDGNWVSSDTYWYDDGTVAENRDSTFVSIYQHEVNLNDAKREINIIKKEYLHQIVGEMNKLFKQ